MLMPESYCASMTTTTPRAPRAELRVIALPAGGGAAAKKAGAEAYTEGESAQGDGACAEGGEGGAPVDGGAR